MDAALMGKVCSKKSRAERPYSSYESLKSQDNHELFKGKCAIPNICGDKNTKEERYNAHYRKPDPKEEILILICIIKKGMKILCRHSQKKQNNECKSPDYNNIYFYIDLSKRLDKFKETFIKIFCSHNGLCCYAKLLKELKSIKHCMSKEIKDNCGSYQCKLNLINCMIACFQSIEKKICFIMASSKNDDCEEECEKSKTKLAEQISKLSVKNSKSSTCKESLCSKCVRKISSKNLCEDLTDKEENNCDKGDNQVFDISLEYCKYQNNNNVSDSSDNSDAEEIYKEQIRNGFVESKIYKKDNQIILSLKCVTNGNVSAITDLKKEAALSEKSDKLCKIANDMAKLLSMSKQWFSSGKDLYCDILNKC